MAMDAIIFARYWEPGKVKTRLCPPLQPDEAAGVNRACLDLLVARLGLVAEVSVVIAFEPDEARHAFAERYPGIGLQPQRGADLTEKLVHIASQRTEPCIITGSDCATVPLDYHRQAVTALRGGADVVLGPTEDGGSYILGVQPGREKWFSDIPWSSGREGMELTLRAQRWGWRLERLPTWYDVDRPSDLVRLAADLRSIIDRGEVGAGFSDDLRFLDQLNRRVTL